MIAGGLIQATMGVEAAQRDLEDIAPPLSAQGDELEEPGEQRDPFTVGERTAVPVQAGDEGTKRGGVRGARTRRAAGPAARASPAGRRRPRARPTTPTRWSTG